MLVPSCRALSALTQSTAQQVASFPGTRRIAGALMQEVIAVAASVGVKLDADPERLLADMQKRVGIPSSTLQDVRAGRPMELDAIINAVTDIARLTGVPVPHLEISAACAGLVNRRIVEDGVAFVPVPVRRPA